MIVSAYLDADGVGACAWKLRSGDEQSAPAFFKLAVHWEPREMDVFALVVANPGRLGPRLQRNDACGELVGTPGGFARAPDDAPNEKGTCGTLPGGAGRIVARGLDMPGLAAFIGTSPGRMVTGRTGLTGV